jgi:hypothetical protein
MDRAFGRAARDRRAHSAGPHQNFDAEAGPIAVVAHQPLDLRDAGGLRVQRLVLGTSAARVATTARPSNSGSAR